MQVSAPLTEIATDICVSFTAADAHVRDYNLEAPCTALASSAAEQGRWALEIMQKSMNARTDSTEDHSLKAGSPSGATARVNSEAPIFDRSPDNEARQATAAIVTLRCPWE
jgi:hypothetical protein